MSDIADDLAESIAELPLSPPLRGLLSSLLDVSRTFRDAATGYEALYLSQKARTDALYLIADPEIREGVMRSHDEIERMTWQP